MREEINVEKLEGVSGGRYVLNGNLHRVYFREARLLFQLKNCTDYQAMELMDSFIGKANTEQEYDNMCIEALKAQGWI